MEISHQFRFSRFLGSILGGLLVCTGFGACTAGEAPEQLTLSGEVRIAASLWADLGPQDAIGPVYLVVTDAKKRTSRAANRSRARAQVALGQLGIGSPQRPAAGESLTVRFEGMPVPAEADLAVWAWVDRDRSAGRLPTHLAKNPITPGDWVADGYLTLTDLGADPGAGPVVLSVDATLRDVDFDGLEESDQNGDGRPDDNCPRIPNPDQKDSDGDGAGDVCDVCPDVFDPLQENSDGLGRGDACNQNGDTACPYLTGYPMTACSVDGDGDEIDTHFYECPEGLSFCDPRASTALKKSLDNCPSFANRDQTDTDGDGEGDACDSDDDNDGIADDADNCPLQKNTDQTDDDSDGVGNLCDACPDVADASNADTDGDALGDVCDADDDEDGVLDEEDNCPTQSNVSQEDRDGDGIGDVCDLCPEHAYLNQSVGEPDQDGDGVGDQCDDCAWPESRPACVQDDDCEHAGGHCLTSGFCLGPGHGR